MFKKTVKFSAILIVLMLCAAVLFAACSPKDKFTPVAIPNKATPEGNGGIAVKYGEWIYYVNGYQGSNSSNNSYNTSEVRKGQIVRIKIDDLEKIIKINDVSTSTSNISNAIKCVVAGRSDLVTVEVLKSAITGIGGAQIVVPNFYYTGDTTQTATNGLYIFNDRIYITTPNMELDANGNYLNTQLLLVSYDLGGGDMQKHFVFKSNAPQLRLTQVGNDVVATFVNKNETDTSVSDLYTLKVGEAKATTVAEKVSDAHFTDKYVYFANENGSVLRHTIGQTGEPVTIINNEPAEDGTKTGKTYAITSVNDDTVYYTMSDNTELSGKTLYYATAESSGNVACDAVPSGNYFGYKDGIVYAAIVPEQSVSMYGIWITKGDATVKTEVLDPSTNGSSITLDKLEGDTLYYTINNLSYKLDLSDASAEPVVIAMGLSTSATGWSLPDILGDYVFTLDTTGGVSVVKFDRATQKNGPTTSIALTVVEEDK